MSCIFCCFGVVDPCVCFPDPVGNTFYYDAGCSGWITCRNISGVASAMHKLSEHETASCRNNCFCSFDRIGVSSGHRRAFSK